MNNIKERVKGKNILVVDDDPRNTFALVSYLEGLDVNIYTAENGFEAINIVSQPSDIEIILMDMMMPEMDGYEAIGRLKEITAARNIPVIAVTAQAMKGDREKCLEAGASDYISKPLNLKELLEKMARLLNLV